MKNAASKNGHPKEPETRTHQGLVTGHRDVCDGLERQLSNQDCDERVIRRVFGWLQTQLDEKIGPVLGDRRADILPSADMLDLDNVAIVDEETENAMLVIRSRFLSIANERLMQHQDALRASQTIEPTPLPKIRPETIAKRQATIARREMERPVASTVRGVANNKHRDGRRMANLVDGLAEHAIGEESVPVRP